jgi:hypothetical protein
MKLRGFAGYEKGLIVLRVLKLASGARLVRTNSDFEVRMMKIIPEWLKPPPILFALHRG